MYLFKIIEIFVVRISVKKKTLDFSCFPFPSFHPSTVPSSENLSIFAQYCSVLSSMLEIFLYPVEGILIFPRFQCAFSDFFVACSCSYHEPSGLRSTNTKIEVGIFDFLGLISSIRFACVFLGIHR